MSPQDLTMEAIRNLQFTKMPLFGAVTRWSLSGSAIARSSSVIYIPSPVLISTWSFLALCDPHPAPFQSCLTTFVNAEWKLMNVCLPTLQATAPIVAMTLKTTSLTAVLLNPKDPEKLLLKSGKLINEIHKRHGCYPGRGSTILQRLTFLKILSQTTITLWMQTGTPRTSFEAAVWELPTTCLNVSWQTHQVSGWNSQSRWFLLWYDGWPRCGFYRRRHKAARALNPNLIMLGEGWEPMLVMKIRLYNLLTKIDEENRYVAAQTTSVTTFSRLSKRRSTCLYHRWQTLYQYHLLKSHCPTNQLSYDNPEMLSSISQPTDNLTSWHHCPVYQKTSSKAKNYAEIHRCLVTWNPYTLTAQGTCLSTLVKNMDVPNNSLIQPIRPCSWR